VIVILPLLIGKGRGEVLTTRADNNGKANITVPLGTKVDDPSVCHPVLRQAQHDTSCEDGEFTVNITSIDPAGNRSEPTILKIIRDTISPNKPKVSEPYMCNQKDICIDLTGEAGTEVIVNNQPTGVIATSTSVTLSLVEGYQPNTNYSFNIQLKDKAGNISQTVIKNFTPPAIPNSGNVAGSSDAFKLVGNVDNKYGDEELNSLGSAEIRLKVTKDNNKYKVELKENKIPAPKITYIEINKDLATIYGIRLNKNFKTNFKIDYFEKSKCKLKLPIVGCLKWDYQYEYREYQDTLDHTAIQFTQKRDWKAGGDKNFGWIWNDSSDGKFSYRFKLKDGNPSLDDFIYAKSHIWFDNTNFEISNENVEIDLKQTLEDLSQRVEYYLNGIVSEKSNIVEIKDTGIEYEKSLILEKYNVELVDGDTQWKYEEVLWVKEAFESLNKHGWNFLYKDYLKQIIRNKVNRTHERAAGYTVIDLANYTNIEIYDNMGAGYKDDERFSSISTIIHEICHVYQHKNGGGYPSAHSNPTEGSLVKEYYLLAGFTKITEPRKINGGFVNYIYTKPEGQEHWGDFVSRYGKDGAYNDEPYEEMAETMTYYILLKAGYLDWNPFETFDLEIDEVGPYTRLPSYLKGDPKNSSLLLSKLTFIQTKILK